MNVGQQFILREALLEYAYLKETLTTGTFRANVEKSMKPLANSALI
jgi:hypothetical protein